MSAPWLLVAGDLTPLGGMDVANYALARYLARTSAEVHLVTHRAWPDLASLPTVTIHRVWRPLGRHLLGSPFLSRAGRGVWHRLRRRGARGIVNGGNCRLPATNWVHYLHAAYEPNVSGSLIGRAKTRWTDARDLAAERRALQEAPIIICNSDRTRRDIVGRIGVPQGRVHVVYYGSDSQRFPSITPSERSAARQGLGYSDERPLVGFVGALGDRRKAFDTLFDAWSALCGQPDWDADLIVVGAGAELPAWRARASERGLANRIRFLGFRKDVPEVLAALDAVVHPARYEAYGLSVHEAICRGLPALVSASAGVAERYSPALGDLLIQNPDSADEVQHRLRLWRERSAEFKNLVAPLSTSLRGQTWDGMAAAIVDVVERAA
jgi:glycosyltransferase involved in cell wall biosynthesis